jgi:hypothetical protein
LKVTENVLSTPRYYFNKKFNIRIRLCPPPVLPSYVPRLGVCKKCGTPKTLETCFVHLVRTVARGRHRGGNVYYSFECKVCKRVATRRNRMTLAGKESILRYESNPLHRMKRLEYVRGIRALAAQQAREKYWMQGGRYA